ncbi:Programmed cell death protein 2 [Fasciola hepatica]|uniref:Programmed cell death protein 2 n=1 Tax=Fasciola hepatica TaxID=6192 RepID=A0A4E0RF48_FASHE|nr:Programmed cell death protein 2 [Fasciola hepatica]
MALLGFASKSVNAAVPSACDSYIGGPLVHFENVLPPPTNLRTCQSCLTHMCFLGHIYCPLSDSPYHRILCLFACLRPECQEKGFSWRVLRSQFFGITQKSANNQNNQWCLPDEDKETQHDWGDGDQPLCEEVTKHQEAILLQGPFRCCFIDVYEETAETSGEELSNQEDISETSKTAAQISSSFASWSRSDAVEREFIGEDDNAVPNAFSGGLELHLATRGEHGCEEVRYWWSGRPVFNGPPPKELADHLKCTRCGASRVFELQLFPTLNDCLMLSPSSGDNDPVDFQLPEPDRINKDWLLRITTVLIFTCSASCWLEGDGWTEECIVVQTDGDRTCIWDGVSPTFCDRYT